MVWSKPIKLSPPPGNRAVAGREKQTVNRACAIGVILTASALAGCQPMTLEQARAECAKQGGFLVVIYTQKVNPNLTLEPAFARPGNCVSPDKFKQAPAGASAASSPPAQN